LAEISAINQPPQGGFVVCGRLQCIGIYENFSHFQRDSWREDGFSDRLWRAIL
jgi:hypothetical protein